MSGNVMIWVRVRYIFGSIVKDKNLVKVRNRPCTNQGTLSEYMLYSCINREYVYD